MTTELNKTRQAGEDLSAAQYHAIALDDGQRAENGGEAGGILINKPKFGEAATLTYMGASRFRAGGAVGAGKALTVATGGWFTAAGSGDYIIGRNGDAAVTSGSIGQGLFDFTKPQYAFSSAFAW